MGRPAPEPAGARRSRVGLWVATGFGVGHAPVAPGTFGSVLGVGLALGLHALGGTTAMIAGLLMLIPLGIRCSSLAESQLGSEDPGAVVIDEIAGQLVALLALPLTAGTVLTGFVLFRLFDIWKPWPARRLEALHGGSGIMADDLVAGLYANLVLQAWIRLAPAGLALP